MRKETVGLLPDSFAGWLPKLALGRFVEICRTGVLEWLHSASLVPGRAVEQMVAFGLADDVFPL